MISKMIYKTREAEQLYDWNAQMDVMELGSRGKKS